MECDFVDFFNYLVGIGTRRVGIIFKKFKIEMSSTNIHLIVLTCLTFPLFSRNSSFSNLEKSGFTKLASFIAFFNFKRLINNWLNAIQNVSILRILNLLQIRFYWILSLTDYFFNAIFIFSFN